MSIGSVIYLSFSSNECIKMHLTAKLEIVADWKLPKIFRWRAGAEGGPPYIHASLLSRGQSLELFHMARGPLRHISQLSCEKDCSMKGTRFSFSLPSILLLGE